MEKVSGNIWKKQIKLPGLLNLLTSISFYTHRVPAAISQKS